MFVCYVRLPIESLFQCPDQTVALLQDFILGVEDALTGASLGLFGFLNLALDGVLPGRIGGLAGLPGQIRDSSLEVAQFLFDREQPVVGPALQTQALFFQKASIARLRQSDGIIDIAAYLFVQRVADQWMGGFRMAQPHPVAGEQLFQHLRFQRLLPPVDAGQDKELLPLEALQRDEMERQPPPNTTLAVSRCRSDLTIVAYPGG
jgi:hypothetical protein